jgi:nondiscriminating glutamyl-tRNA synthetase
MATIKTRFAPSPTGYLHVGGLRTALYCYLFAKANKGKFVLRIEDTDQERFVKGAMENLIETLKWVGIEHDEGPILKNGKVEEIGKFGPYIQSKRFDIYRKYADELVEKSHAYYCFCTKERLNDLHKVQESRKQATMYDRRCASIPLPEAKKRIESGEPYVIRQKIPYETLKFKDLIRGNVQFDGKTIDDQVLIKSDGFPTYHLANVVDDHLMEITHVIRGEEWLPSTPKHIFLYKAFGWKMPEFAHIPLLLNEDRSKLSKRQGDVSVNEYIEKGYLKEAIINFAALLGWHQGAGEEQEIFSLKELGKLFSLDRVHKAGAIFNITKLDWFNWQWTRRLFFEKLALEPTQSPKKRSALLLEICEKYLNPEFKKKESLLEKALLSTEEKVLKEPKNINANIEYFFTLKDYDRLLLTHEKMNVDFAQAKASLTIAKESLSKLTDKNWTQEKLKETLLKEVEKAGIKNGQLLWPIRAAVTGIQFSAGAFETLWTIGKKESLERIEKALKKL